MLYGIESAARQAGHSLSFVTLSKSGNDMASTLHRLRASHVQGVIIVAPVRRADSGRHRTRRRHATRRGRQRSRDWRFHRHHRPVEGGLPAARHLLDLATAQSTTSRDRRPGVDATARMRICWSDALRAHPAPRGRSVAGTGVLRRGYEADGWPMTVTSPPSSPPTTRLRSGDPWATRRRSKSPRGRERGRLRRHAGIGLLPPALDHRPPGLRRGGPPKCRAPVGARRR